MLFSGNNQIIIRFYGFIRYYAEIAGGACSISNLICMSFPVLIQIVKQEIARWAPPPTHSLKSRYHVITRFFQSR
jgi:hypothetical protein